MTYNRILMIVILTILNTVLIITLNYFEILFKY